MSDEGDDSPPRPKRKIKRVVVVSSSSDSDSDETVGVAGSRRKKLRILSDDDGNDSSGSSVFRAGTRRRRTLPKLKDSDAESDSSGWGSERSGAAPAAAKPSGFSSDSSEGNSDKCSICLLRFTDQEVGIPESCEHIFCLDCILEWSKNVNTCPVDRMLFNSIVVRACMGGRVVRTQPVQVQRRSSVDTFVMIEELTVCEVCSSAEGEETMLLCDRCDLGYHMQCLSPPLTEIPPDMWLCPNCRDTDDAAINLSEVEDIIGEFLETSPPTAPRPSALRRAPRAARRSLRRLDQPSTSRAAPAAAPAAARRRPTARRKYKRRRAKTVVIEYEVQENGKFPITKKVTRKVKKRRVKRRQPRTAARRSHVLASVRARLATLHAEPALAPAPAGALAVSRRRAGIPTLSLLGDPNELDYFSDDGDAVSEDAAAAVARRPAAALSAYRQARRKLAAAPSPPHAAAAPDLLADILERQTLLHSKRAVLRLSADGAVSVQLPPAAPPRADRVDPATASAPARQAPSHPGGGRAGGWGGGYRGAYRRDQTADFNRGGGYDAPAARAGLGGYGGASDARRDDVDYYDSFPRRPQYASDDAFFGRRRPAPEPRPFPVQRAADQTPARYGPGAWQPYAPRADAPPAQARHSFGGFENPVDMRMGQMPPTSPVADAFARRAAPPAYRPLAEPPVFSFPKTAEPDRSEDERSDSGLVIDTEKYDPTEPTHDDDDSGDDAAPAPPTPPAPPPPALTPPGLDLAAGVLDSAVRQVLSEHRSALAPAAERSDDESDGDCPNFSIYSAASVHIASSSALNDDAASARAPDGLANLVQQDDSPPSRSPATPDERTPPTPDERTPPTPDERTPPDTAASGDDYDEKKKSEEEYKEKVSKRCPITVNKRDPIKIKLNTPSLIKRQITLYDDEEASQDADDAPAQPQPSGVSALEKEAVERVDDETKLKGASDECDESIQSLNKSSFKDNINGDSQYEKAASPRVEEPAESEERARHEHDEDKVDFEKAEENNNENLANDKTDDAAGEGDDAGDSSSREAEREDDAVEKMTESISETEDERSYTPCLDENRPAEDALRDTELISDDDALPSEPEAPAPAAPRRRQPDKKKKKKDSKREPKDKAKAKKKADVAFKKLSKSGKERNYRERERDDKRERRSADAERARRRRDKRKDLERYDVRSVVSEKRRKLKDAFGRDVSPRARSPSPSPPPRSASPARRSPSRRSFSRRSPSRPRRSLSRPRPSPARLRRSASKVRRSLSGFRRSPSRGRKSPARLRRSISRRRSPSPPRRSPSRGRRSALGRKSSSRRGSVPRARSPSPPRARRSPPRSRRSASPLRRRSASPARRRSGTPLLSPRRRKRRRSASPAARSPPRRTTKKKKRARATRRAPPSPARKRRRTVSRGASPSPASRPPSPRTPPPEPAPSPSPRRRRDPERRRRVRDAVGPSKEVFTSGDNILVSVSFKEQERGEEGARRRRRDSRRERRRRRRLAAAPDDAPKPVAIIDLERSPFRELTPSPRNVIVLSDSEPGEPPAAPPAPAPPPEPAAGPKTPPEPAAPAPAPSPAPAAAPSPDAYDPFEPTRSPSPPAAAPPSPARPHMTLEAAQRSNLSADDVLARRPLTPVEKVMALLQSTRDAEEAEAPPAPRIVLPSPTRAPPKLFPGKPSPIKSNPVKPMQAARLPRDDGASPYSPGSSDFGELFEPPPRRAVRRKRGKTQVGVKLDDDNLKILDELPSSAVELQVKSKFLKKLNRQERVVEEVKLVLKPHYNKKRVTKDEYKDILRRAVPKICHNKSGEINPTKIQALVEAYVKKFRKKHKLGVA
ncbi:PHD and RING finger domain-containing protein 1 isoform X2 [Maniola jurtina]|uniref:PHD and RING finger domain-containing protein 1 isoform X2 n=1 Tax=Maniola jurtina TaxID=191418 RepID=UPI001E68BD25|nr:PHD and RING finger domain-containing protein 1 isoform X2 [Maniola jurtina]